MIKKGYGQGIRDRCAICGMEADNTCRICGRKVCSVHYDSIKRVCTLCSKRTQSEYELTTCNVCNANATHKCPKCGKHVCDLHFDSNLNMCVMCRIRAAREKMKKEG
ncbi:hypothetical protein M1614_01930 [Candidatus Marsarchaeota archaeon]|nr:hypothetical protein [Candidatus Marsarchaeota archaeon]MCL5089904.1 hypothetical protein [Candidatus Marsarchaeota archaeon]